LLDFRVQKRIALFGFELCDANFNSTDFLPKSLLGL
jgi:hypothetical protein